MNNLDLSRVYIKCLSCRCKRAYKMFIINNKLKKSCRICLLKSKYYYQLNKDKKNRKSLKYPPFFYKDEDKLYDRIYNLIILFNENKINLNELFNYMYYYEKYHNLNIKEKNDLLNELVFYYNLKLVKS